MARPPVPPRPELTLAAIVDLLRRGCWASLPIATVESLVQGGRIGDFPAGRTVYAEADTEGLAVVVQGLLRVFQERTTCPPS